MNVDFIYSSMMTSLIRLTARTNDARSDYECLRHARNALSSLNLLLRLVAQPCSFREMSMSSLAWYARIRKPQRAGALADFARLVPLFPLRPMYIVFSNIVATSDPLDLKLLQDTATGLHPLAQTHASMKAVHELCSSLIDLCTAFVRNTETSQGLQSSQLGLTGSNTPSTGQIQEREGLRQQGRPKIVPLNPAGQSIVAPGNFNQELQGPMAQEQSILAGSDNFQTRYHFDDDLDWELFCAQPSLDFFTLDERT